MLAEQVLRIFDAVDVHNPFGSMSNGEFLTLVIGGFMVWALFHIFGSSKPKTK